METEMEYTKDTLYVFMKGKGSKKAIHTFQKKLYHILDDYAIYDIVIDRKGIIKMDEESFSLFLDDYDTKYGGNLDVIN